MNASITSEVEPQTGALYRLIYVSRARPVAADLNKAVLSEILDVSIRRNEKAGITGALLFCGGWFVQALEGTHRDASEVYARICSDSRHDVVGLLTFAAITARDFGHWSMCGRELSDTDAAIVRLLANKGRFDASRLVERSALSLLALVRDLQTPQNTPWRPNSLTARPDNSAPRA